eukprot:214880-Chlamydomonas_euryale.AAC.9
MAKDWIVRVHKWEPVWQAAYVSGCQAELTLILELACVVRPTPQHFPTIAPASEFTHASCFGVHTCALRLGVHTCALGLGVHTCLGP